MIPGERITVTLPDCYALTITVPAGSQAYITRLSDQPGGGDPYTPTSVLGSDLTLGPYGTPRRYEILCTMGTVSYSMERAEPLTLASIGAYPIVLASSGQRVLHTGTTDYTSIVDLTIPAGVLQVGDVLRLTMAAQMVGAYTDGAYVYADLDNSTPLFYSIFSAAEGRAYVGQNLISINAEDEQYANDLTGDSAPVFGRIAGNIDLTNSVNVTTDPLPIIIHGAVANAANTLAVMSYCLERIPAVALA